MSDIEYSASESDSESVEQLPKLRKQKKAIGKDAKLYDEEGEENSDAESGSDDDVSVAESGDDGSDIDDMNPEEMDENVLFADMAKKDEDEFQFGFNSGDEGSDLDDDDDDEDVYDEDVKYLQKLDESVKQQTIANHHPELIIHNYDEVEALSVVVKDERGVIIDPLHRTLPFLTKYERTRILGERAKQINDGAKPFVESDPSIIDGYLIALKELEERKLPFILRRPLSNGASEYWKLKDLEFL